MISNKGENLVFILSLPRSGSTILSLLLGNHSAILCPPEPWFLLKLATLTYPCAADSTFDEELTALGTKEFLPEQILLESTRAFATTAYNSYLTNSDKIIFIDKTPRYYNILPLLDKLFPQARKLWLNRNPLDVAASYRQSWNIDLDVILGQKVAPLSLDFAVGLFELATYFKSTSSSKFQIQYERLVNNPQEILSDICAWLGIPFEPTMLDYSQHHSLLAKHSAATMGDKKALTTTEVHTQSTNKWVEAFTLSELQQLVDLWGFDIFQQLGYGNVITSLQTLGIQTPSEMLALERREQIGKTRLNKILELREQIDAFQSQWRASEADRQEGVQVIARLTHHIEAVSADYEKRGEVILEQQQTIARLTQHIEAVSADYEKRGQVILEQQQTITRLAQYIETSQRIITKLQANLNILKDNFLVRLLQRFGLVKQESKIEGNDE